MHGWDELPGGKKAGPREYLSFEGMHTGYSVRHWASPGQSFIESQELAIKGK